MATVNNKNFIIPGNLQLGVKLVPHIIKNQKGVVSFANVPP